MIGGRREVAPVTWAANVDREAPPGAVLSLYDAASGTWVYAHSTKDRETGAGWLESMPGPAWLVVRDPARFGVIVARNGAALRAAA